MCSVGVKNILHRQAIIVGNPYFNLVAWDTFPAFIHEKCGFADSERICNNFCILVTAQIAQTLTDFFAIYFCHPPLLVHLLYSNTHGLSIRIVHKLCSCV